MCKQYACIKYLNSLEILAIIGKVLLLVVVVIISLQQQQQQQQNIINKTILEEVKTRKRNLLILWIYYRKAFDSIPHSWLEKSVKIYTVCPTKVIFMTESMKDKKSTLNLNHTNGSLTSRPINIKSGIFQGDSLSPLLFCLAEAPLSYPLNSSYGYKSQNGKRDHLFYIDDLKTFANDVNQQKNLLIIVKTFCKDNKMEFGIDKCAKATFKDGRLTKNTDLDIDINKIKELDKVSA